jgi:hypothetical protein
VYTTYYFFLVRPANQRTITGLKKVGDPWLTLWRYVISKLVVARRRTVSLNYRVIDLGLCEEHHKQTGGFGQDFNRVPAKSHLLPLYKLARFTCAC